MGWFGVVSRCLNGSTVATNCCWGYATRPSSTVLRAYFARHPQLPKLGSILVLQNCVSRGVRDGVFGIALGASRNAPDSVLKIGTEISADEVQFQPGVYLVKAGPIREEIAKRAPVTPTPSPVTPEPGGATTGGDRVVTTPVEPGEDQDEEPVPDAGTTSVHIKLTGVPADRARDVLKVAILPLAATGATVEVNMQITANSENGIPAETLDLVVAEGLRQLGIEFEIDKQ